jgi:hypothetical protein
VIPVIVRLAAVESLTEQEAPASVIVTVVLFVPPVVAVAVQLVNPLPRAIVGVAGTEKAVLKTAVIVSPAARCPVPLVVNPTVHVAVLFAV